MNGTDAAGTAQAPEQERLRIRPFADEPTAALDTDRGMKVMALLRRVARDKRAAVIAVTHDHPMIEGFDTVYEMNDGRLARKEVSTRAAASAR